MRWIDRFLSKVGLARIGALQDCAEVLRIEGGAGKRLDEHRELVELLESKAPQLLADHIWVDGWLESQDRYLDALRCFALERNLIPEFWERLVRKMPGRFNGGGRGFCRSLMRSGRPREPAPDQFVQTTSELRSMLSQTNSVLRHNMIDLVQSGEEKHETLVDAAWMTHAYPLQQIEVRLQGTRHSDRAAIIDQLETVLARLRAGDNLGSEHDDDFGYSFSYRESPTGPSFFDAPAGRG